MAHICDCCKKEFPFASKLLAHSNRKIKCRPNSTFDCEVCSKQLKSRKALLYHKQSNQCKPQQPRHLEILPLVQPQINLSLLSNERAETTPAAVQPIEFTSQAVETQTAVEVEEVKTQIQVQVGVTSEYNQHSTIPGHITDLLKVTTAIPAFYSFIKQKLSAPHMILFELFLQLRMTQTDKFCVDFDQLWQTLEFSRKDNATRLLQKILQHEIDFTIRLKADSQISPIHRGGKKENIYMLTIEAAQRFALQSQTAKSNEIVDFFVKVLKIVQDYYLLSALFEQNQKHLDQQEQVLLDSIPDDAQINYIADIGIHQGIRLSKIGISDNYKKYRHTTHKRDFPYFRLKHYIICSKNRAVEQLFMEDAFVKTRRRKLKINGKVQTELFEYDDKWSLEDIKACHIKFAEQKTDDKALQRKHEEKMLELETEKLAIESKLEIQKMQMELELQKSKADLEIERMKFELEMARIRVQENQMNLQNSSK